MDLLLLAPIIAIVASLLGGIVAIVGSIMALNTLRRTQQQEENKEKKFAKIDVSINGKSFKIEADPSDIKYREIISLIINLVYNWSKSSAQRTTTSQRDKPDV